MGCRWKQGPCVKPGFQAVATMSFARRTGQPLCPPSPSLALTCTGTVCASIPAESIDAHELFSIDVILMVCHTSAGRTRALFQFPRPNCRVNLCAYAGIPAGDVHFPGVPHEEVPLLLSSGIRRVDAGPWAVPWCWYSLPPQFRGNYRWVSLPEGSQGSGTPRHPQRA